METIHIGERIKRLIDRHGHTVEEASRRIKISTSNLYKKLNDIDADTEFLRRVANVYGVSLSYFLSESQQYKVEQSGTINAVGEKIMQTYATAKTTPETINSKDNDEVFIERLKTCEAEKQGYVKQIELLEKMIKMYESASKTGGG